LVINYLKKVMMKKNISILSLALSVLLFMSSCIKNDDIKWTGSIVEFDVATYTTKSGGLPFPLLNRVPTGYGRSLNATLDPILTNRVNAAPNDTVRMRINLVSAQKATAQVVTVKISPNFSTAVKGVHFDLLDETVTIPANSNFGIARWVTRNPGAPLVSGTTVQVVFELSGNAEIQVSENFKYVGWLITQ
jgi:hypothetical protein